MFFKLKVLKRSNHRCIKGFRRLRQELEMIQKVLFIDDDSDICEIYQQHLEILLPLWKIFVAKSFEQAKQLFLENSDLRLVFLIIIWAQNREKIFLIL